MFKVKSAFSGFSVNDMAAAKQFYQQALGLDLRSEEMGLQFVLPGGGVLFLYEKPDHQPATFTVLNFVVENIDTAYDQLQQQDVAFEHYDSLGGATPDDKGILRGKSINMGPNVAWFKDPAGNILSIVED